MEKMNLAEHLRSICLHTPLVLMLISRYCTLPLSKNAVVIGGPTVMEKASSIRKFVSLRFLSLLISYGTNSTHAMPERIAAMPEVIAADMLFLPWSGGGRAIDEGKEIATILDVSYTLPTLASNCAPCNKNCCSLSSTCRYVRFLLSCPFIPLLIRDYC